MQSLLCPWEPSTYLFFSENVPGLIHYSHAVAVLAALGIGLFIFTNNPKDAVSRLILLFVSLFTAWAALDVVLWATNRPDVVMFSWSLQVLIEPLTYGLAFYLFHLFLYKRWPTFRVNILVVMLFLPLLALLPTHFNLEALSLSSCEAVEGPIAKFYTYIIHTIFMFSIVFMGVRKIPRLSAGRERLIAFLFGFGLVTFLLSFTSGNILGSFTDDWTLSQYGLFGMPVFAGLIAYSIVKFKAFKAKVIASQMLVVILAMAVISLATLQQIQNVQIVASITFVLVCVLGYVLVRSVKKEIEQREHIEKLAGELEETNKRQETLIHFVGHEVKGFLTKAQGALAALSEGDLGQLPEASKPFVEHALAETRTGVESVTALLKASNQKKGTISYQMGLFDLCALVKNLVEKERPTAEAKGLKMTFVSDAGSTCTMTGDKAEIGDHVLRNLIENAINYTPSGSIEISLKRTSGAYVFTVKDTGVGITDEDKKRLFTEGGHGKDSQKINVHSTGYGLFIAKNIVEAHHGKISAFSEGAGKGSTFTVELPA